MEIAGDNNFCQGDSTTLSVTGNGNYIAYEWSDGNMTDQNVISGTGTYSLTVTSIQGCTASDTVDIIAFDNPDIGLVDSLAICEADTVLLEAPPGFNYYEWQDGSLSADIAINQSGLYVLSVIDTNGCAAQDSTLAFVQANPMPEILGENSFCPGDNTTLTLNDNWPGLLWSTGEDSTAIVIATPGVYNVTVSDEYGCTGQDSIILDTFSIVPLDITGPPGLCPGDTTLLEVPSAYQSYEWSNNTFDNSISVSTAGLYAVTVVDNNDCQTEASFTLQAFSQPAITIIGQDSICGGTSTLLSASDLSYPTYEWSNNIQAASIEAGEAGWYVLSIIDNNGCEASDSLLLTTISAPNPQILGDSLICEGTSTQLSLNDTYPAYDWGNGNNDPTLIVDTQGPYSVTVTDDFGCAGSAVFNLSLAPLPVPQITGDNGICEGDMILLEAAVLYDSLWWSTGITATSILIDTAGVYALFAQDDNGCIDSTTINVQAQALPTLTISGPEAICEGDTVQLSVATDGTSIDWSTGASTAAIDVFQANTYAVNVTSINGCTSSDSVSLAINSLPSPTILGDSLICEGTSTQLSLNNTYPAYDWGNGNNDPTLTADAQGLYSVTVTDDFGCAGSAVFNLSLAPLPVPQITGDNGICEGDMILLEAAVLYDSLWWSTGITATSILIDTAGVYALFAQDDNGCIDSTTINVQAQALPTLTISGPEAICEGDTVQLSVATDGTSIDWSTGASTAAIDVFQANTYAVNVTSINGCTSSDSVSLAINSLPSPTILGDSLICEGTSTQLSLNDTYPAYDWGNGNNDPTLTADAQGPYSVTVTDDFGCAGSAVFNLSLAPLPVPQITGDNGICEGDMILLEAAVLYDSLWWSTGITATSILIDTAGVYALFAQDDNGCIDSTTINVQAQALPTLIISGPEAICEGDTVQLSVATDGTSIDWSTGASTAAIDVFQADTYAVEITGSNGCVQTDSIAVIVNELPVYDAGEDQTLNCIIEEVAIGTSGPSTNTVYQWSGPGILPDSTMVQQPTVALEGIYTVIVTDTLTSCVSLPDTVLVEDLSYDPIATLQLADTLDCASPVITLTATGSSTGTDFIYLWLVPDNQITVTAIPSLETSEAGNYTLTVLDTLTGCSADASAMVAANFEYPVLSIDPPLALSCIQDTVSLMANASTPSGMINIQWLSENQQPISGANQLMLEVQDPGWYYLFVTETLSACQTVDSIEVLDNIVFPVADAGNNQEIDCLSLSATLDGSSSSQGIIYAYTWTSPEGTAIEGTLQPTVNTSGTYLLTVVNLENGCESTDLVEVDIDDAFLLNADANLIPPLCEGDANGQVFINNIIGGTPPFLYSLNDSPFTDQASFTGLNEGQYTLTIEDLEGCTIEVPFYMEDGTVVQVELGDNIEINLGDQLELNAQTNLLPSEIGQVIWSPADTFSCNDCLAYSSFPLQSSLYTATVVDTNGCTGTDIVQVFLNKESSVYIPNGFSPNDDGANDTFLIYAGDDVVQVNSFSIYNRWGGLLFEANDFQPNDPAFGWDGTHMGQELDPAVFVYAAEIVFVDGRVEIFKGDVLLVK
jgi:gliding motility-associated-like protein